MSGASRVQGGPAHKNHNISTLISHDSLTIIVSIISRSTSYLTYNSYVSAVKVIRFVLFCSNFLCKSQFCCAIERQTSKYIAPSRTTLYALLNFCIWKHLMKLNYKRPHIWHDVFKNSLINYIITHMMFKIIVFINNLKRIKITATALLKYHKL